VITLENPDEDHSGRRGRYGRDACSRVHAGPCLLIMMKVSICRSLLGRVVHC